MMKADNLDISSTKDAYQHKSAEIHDKYCFVFFTSIMDKQREDAEKVREQSKQRKRKGKQKSKNQTKSFQLYNLDAEKLGTAVIYIPQEIGDVKIR